MTLQSGSLVLWLSPPFLRLSFLTFTKSSLTPHRLFLHTRTTIQTKKLLRTRQIAMNDPRASIISVPVDVLLAVVEYADPEGSLQLVQVSPIYLLQPHLVNSDSPTPPGLQDLHIPLFTYASRDVLDPSHSSNAATTETPKTLVVWG